MSNTEITNASRDAAARSAEKTAADAQMAELIAAHQNSSEVRTQRDRDELARLTGDPYHLDGSQREIDVLKGRIAQAEAGADAAVAAQVLTDAQRVDLALKGEGFRGASATTEGQIPASDFARAVQDDIALGIPATLAKAFYSTGLSDDPLGYIDGKFWLDRYASDPEMQRLHAAGDPVITMRHKAATMYVLGKHPNISPEIEAARLAELRHWNN